jgi:hypothetical protein
MSSPHHQFETKVKIVPEKAVKVFEVFFSFLFSFLETLNFFLENFSGVVFELKHEK